MYEMRFWFEHGGTCLWSKNDEAQNKFGYAVDYEALPLHQFIKNKIMRLEDEYATILDWNCSSNPLLWMKKRKLILFDALHLFLMRYNKNWAMNTY